MKKVTLFNVALLSCIALSAMDKKLDIWDAIKKHNHSELRQILDKDKAEGTRVRYSSELWTTTGWALKHRNLTALQSLLESGITPNLAHEKPWQKKSKPASLLAYIVKHLWNHSERHQFLSLLDEYHVNIHWEQEIALRTAITIKKKKERIAAVGYLLDHGADPQSGNLLKSKWERKLFSEFQQEHTQ